MNRRLYRCRNDRRIAGVASGIAEYFDADPTIVRILWVISIFFGGFGLLLYVAMAIIVPVEPEEAYMTGDQPRGSAGVAGATGDAPGQAGDATGQAEVPSATSWHSAPTMHRHASRGGSGRAATFFGVILILFGVVALVNAFLPASIDGGRFLWPAFIVGIGALLVATAVRREPTES